MNPTNKKLTESVESSEQSERIDDNIEANPNKDTEIDEIWSQIGDMTLTDVTKSVWSYLKKLKIRNMVWGTSICIGIVLAGIITFHISRLLFPLIWIMANDSYAMIVGRNYDYEYSLFDGDLVYSIPFCLIVASIVGIFSKRNKLLLFVLYFILLLSILEIWNYWQIAYNVNEVLGVICFVLMFITVPILYTIRALIPIFFDKEDDASKFLSSEALKSND